MIELKKLIAEREEINSKIDTLLADEMTKVRKIYHGNSHTISDIYVADNGDVILDIWYDDWERSCNVSWRIKQEEVTND